MLINRSVRPKTTAYAFTKQINIIVVAKSYLHSKLTEFFFLLRFECAFDCLEIELVTHLVEIRAEKDLAYRLTQAGTS